MRRQMWFVLAVPMVFGCASHEAAHVKDTGPAHMPNGWVATQSTEDGISIGVPPGWRSGVGYVEQFPSSGSDSTDPNAAAANAALSQFGDSMQAQFKHDEKAALAKLREEGIVINVVENSRPIIGEERTRYFVQKTTHSGNCSLEDAIKEEKEYLRVRNPKGPTMVDLPLGKVAVFTSGGKNRIGDQENRICYVVADGSNTYALRFVATNNPTIINDVSYGVASTWRIKPSMDKP